MPTAIVMTLCHRPLYTRRVLDALAACDGVEQLPVILMCEPVSEEVVDLAVAFGRRPGIKATVMRHDQKVGCNVNTFLALQAGFAEADRVIALEDDTVPARDFLRFAQWGLDTYMDDATVFSVCGYQRTPPSELHYREAVVREAWFTPWGWATWRDRWESICEAWPHDDRQISWDTVIDKATRRDRCEVRPLVARIQNIGGELGTHVPSPIWHSAHHANPNWIETTVGPDVAAWQEVDATVTTALRSHHPC
jgi:hypothetical protein